MPAFKDEIKAKLKNPDTRRDKFSSNSLFAKAGQLDKTVKDLSKNDSKVRFLALSMLLFTLGFFRSPRL